MGRWNATSKGFPASYLRRRSSEVIEAHRERRKEGEESGIKDESGKPRLYAASAAAGFGLLVVGGWGGGFLVTS